MLSRRHRLLRALLALLLAICTLSLSLQFWFFGTAAPFALPLLGTLLAAVSLGYEGAVIVLLVSGLGAAYYGWPDLRGMTLLQPLLIASALEFLLASGLILILAGRER